MTATVNPPDKDREAAEARALAAAVATAEANPKRLPHQDVRPWLSRLGAGALDTQPPTLPLKALLASAPLDGIDLNRDRDTGRGVDL